MDNGINKPNILHVDNDREFLDIYSVTFSKWFNITSVDTGDRALDALKREKIECVVTDYDMPGMNGIELLWEIKQLYPRMPVLFFTGQGNEQVAREAFVLGASDYFTKDFYGPAATEKLINSIKTQVEKFRVEKALFDSQEIYRTIFETACTALFIVEEDSTISLVNNTFSELSGYSKKEIEGKMKWQQFIHPDSIDMMEQFFVDRYSDPASVPASYECKAVRRDNKILYIYVSVSMIPATKKRVISWLDITSQKESEIARSVSESRFGAIFDTAVDSIFIKDNLGRYTQINKAMVRLFGIKEEEIIGKTDFDLFSEHDATVSKEIDDKVMSGEIIDLEHTKSIYGKQYTFHVIKSPLKDINGKITGLCGIARDITQKKIFEEDIRSQKELLSNIISHIPHFVFWKDRQSRFLGCNQNIARVAGLNSPDELIGKTDYDMPWKKEESDYYVECDRKVMETGVPILNIEETQLQADGKEAVLLTSKVPLRDAEGDVIGILGIFADITERKKMEADLEEKQRHFRTIIDSLGDYVIILDKDLNFIDGNKALTSAFNIDEIDRHSGKPLPMVIPQLPETFVDALNTVLKNGESSSLSCPNIPTGDGEKSSVKILPIKNQTGEVESIVAIAQNLSPDSSLDTILKLCRNEKPDNILITDLKTVDYDNTKI